MALKPLNSVGGFSVGEVPANVIFANGDFSGNKANFTGNIAALGILTDNYYYANGSPVDFQQAAGSNTQIQFNNNNDFGASANFTFNSSTNLLTVTGNINATNVNASTLNSNVANGTAPLTVASQTVVANLNADLLDGYNSATANTANTVAVRDASGNLSANYFVGNGAFLTGIDASLISNGSANVRTFNNGNVTVSASGNANVLVVAGDGANITGTLGVTGNVTAPNFIGNVVGNISGNIVIPGSNTGVVFNDSGNANSLLGFTFDKTSNAVTANGNLTVNNANLGNLVVANFANVASNVTTSNLTVNLELAGNTANFTGNIKTLNANLGNLAVANFVQTGQIFLGNSNVAIAANANVTFSVAGTANVLTVSSAGANIVGYVSANGNGTFGALYSNTLTSQGGNLTVYAATGDNYIELRPTGNGHVDVGNFRIQNLGTPNAASDAATKQYVDDVAQGLHTHDACQAATPDTLANVTGGTITYNNGTSGVGANLVTTGSFNLIDGVNVQTAGTRILVKNEANTAHNGIYVWSNATVITRADDFNTPVEMAGGDFTFVQAGTTYDNTGWVMPDAVTTVGTSPVVWVQFSGAGTYTAGQGLTLTGSVFSVNVDNTTTEIAGGNVVVKANAQFTTPNIGAATGTSVNLTGNVLADNVNANAKVTAANIEVTSNVLANNFTANSNITANNATINLSLSGNTANFSGNVVVNNLGVNLALAGNTANFSGNIQALNVNGGNLVTANFFTGTLINGTSNVAVVNNGNVNITAGGNTSLVVTATGANVTGNLGVTGNISGNVVSANTFSATNNVAIGTTAIRQGTLTTTAITANQTIATVAVTGITGAEFLVKGVDSSGSKYTVATVTAVTDGSNVDYTQYGGVTLGSSTGVLAVNIVGSNIALQVTPASTNSTAWTTQYRTI